MTAQGGTALVSNTFVRASRCDLTLILRGLWPSPFTNSGRPLLIPSIMVTSRVSGAFYFSYWGFPSCGGHGRARLDR